MEIKNLKYTVNGSVDCEINHPKYGWIPFTASPDDCEEHGRQIYQEATEGKYGPITEYIAPPPPEPEPPDYGLLSTDKWAIPADSKTYATVTFTSGETVHFIVDDDVYSVDPVDHISTLEITADAPGTIHVSVQNKSLAIAATEVI